MLNLVQLLDMEKIKIKTIKYENQANIFQSELFLFLELGGIFIALPAIIAITGAKLGAVNALVLIAVSFFMFYQREKSFDEPDSFYKLPTKKHLIRILLLSIPMLGFLYFFTYTYFSDTLFLFPKEKTEHWVMVMIFYPLLSVIPQEIIFRLYFFQRYKRLFTDSNSMILASAAFFAYAHIIYRNPIAVVFTFFAGLVFSYTYKKSGSLSAVVLEHSIYGLAVFTIGLGKFFYSGPSI